MKFLQKQEQEQNLEQVQTTRTFQIFLEKAILPQMRRYEDFVVMQRILKNKKEKQQLKKLRADHSGLSRDYSVDVAKRGLDGQLLIFSTMMGFATEEDKDRILNYVKKWISFEEIEKRHGAFGDMVNNDQGVQRMYKYMSDIIQDLSAKPPTLAPTPDLTPGPEMFNVYRHLTEAQKYVDKERKDVIDSGIAWKSDTSIDSGKFTSVDGFIKQRLLVTNNKQDRFDSNKLYFQYLIYCQRSDCFMLSFAEVFDILIKKHCMYDYEKASFVGVKIPNKYDIYEELEESKYTKM